VFFFLVIVRVKLQWVGHVTKLEETNTRKFSEEIS